MNQTANSVRMMASFNRGIYVPLVGPNADPNNVYNYLKDKNARISLEHVRGLMEGREELFKDFEVVTILDARTIRGESIPASSPVASDTAQAVVNADVKQTVAPVVRRVPGTTGPQQTNLQSGSPQVARGRGREYAPSGIIKPLKRGTVYAQLMEMLMKGATMKELLAAVGNQTAGGVNDVLSWQIKQRGYGLRFDAATGKYHLVLPQGHTALVYQD